jgi:hypothetical protein
VRLYSVDRDGHAFEAFDPWRRFADRKLAPDYLDWLVDHHDDTIWIRDVPLAHEAAALATRSPAAGSGLDLARTYAIYAVRLATFHAQMGESAEALAVLAEPVAAFQAAIEHEPGYGQTDVLDRRVLVAPLMRRSMRATPSRPALCSVAPTLGSPISPPAGAVSRPTASSSRSGPAATAMPWPRASSARVRMGTSFSRACRSVRAARP